MRRGLYLIVLSIALVFVGAGCKRTESPVRTTVKPPVSAHGPSEVKPLEQFKRIPFRFGVVDYYHQGKLYATYLDPFENCTQPGDYMIVRKKDDPTATAPLLGLRVVREKTYDPLPVTETSFVATVDGRKIAPQIRRIPPNEPGFWEVIWKLDPTWQEIRVDQDIIATFQIVIGNEKVDWSLLPAAFKPIDPVTGKPKEVCFP